jgi:hypothetical protein
VILVVGEVATALVLMTGAGLLTMSFVRTLAVNPGFESRNVMTFPIALTRWPLFAGGTADRLLSQARGAGRDASRCRSRCGHDLSSYLRGISLRVFLPREC